MNCSLGPVGNFTTSGFGSGGGSAGSQQGGSGGGMVFIYSSILQINGYPHLNILILFHKHYSSFFYTL